MKVFRFLAIITIIAFSINGQAQYRQGGCQGSQNAGSQWYFTPYVGIGGAYYSYDLNGSVVDANGKSYEKEESKLLWTIPVGFNILYRFNKVNFGAGLLWQGFYGDSENGYTQNDVNLYLYKAHLRLEIPFYRDPFFDYGMSINAGGFLANNYVGESPKLPVFGELGLFYNHVLSSNSSLFTELNFEYGRFNTTINLAESQHQYRDLKFIVGYRFWF